MNRHTATAGKTANSCAKWRTAKRGGRTVAIAPDGRAYYGTAAEVRGARLMPWRRDWLAQSLTALRRAYDRPEEREALRLAVADSRRYALRMGWSEADTNRASVAISAELLILAQAAAKACGQSMTEWAEGWLRMSVNAARREPDGLTLTKHEQAALAAIRNSAQAGERAARA
ncbi:MAG: hypothetical protein K6F50_06780 [Kiritimatiellae bacterium]|nr:hypothetical protein [Kiritimatiellia bacterium]